MAEVLRILILNHEFPPIGTGASAGTYAIAKGYVERGHAVSVVTMQYNGLPATESKAGIQIHRVPSIRRRSDRCTVPELLTYILSARRFLARHLRTHSYDLAHTQFILPAGAVALWAKRTFALPYILTSRGSDVLGHNPRFRMIYPLVSRAWFAVLRDAEVVTCASQYLASRIHELRPDVRVVTIPNVVDSRRFRPSLKEKRILIVGRLIPLKGVDDILESLTQLDLTGWQVDIVGDGSSRSALERLAGRRGLARHVTFHGWIDHDSERLREMYGRASIFVLASHRENMSVALLEAMAAGCRIVASNVGGTPEVVQESSLFEGRNIAALRQKLASAMAACAARAVEPLAARFRPEHVITQYESLCWDTVTANRDRELAYRPSRSLATNIPDRSSIAAR
jgi:glycosyltransferase involved in cell wall biosynthesis